MGARGRSGRLGRLVEDELLKKQDLICIWRLLEAGADLYWANRRETDYDIIFGCGNLVFGPYEGS
jgi:hypothetical protein